MMREDGEFAQRLAEATMLLNSAQRALERGCQHYDEAGKLLTTPREVLEALLSENVVHVVDPDQTPSGDA